MTPEEAIDVLQEIISPCVAGKWKEAVDAAISALQAQDSETRKICDTCKHDPPSKKWPCVDCDMREPADRWKPKDVPDTNAGDMVSRQNAIDALMDEFKRVPTTAIRAKNRIDRLPSAQPEQRWIPCSERLPDMWDERYLVSLAWGGIGVMEYKSTGFHNYGSFTPAPIESIAAWMPLPEPYAERRTDEGSD